MDDFIGGNYNQTEEQIKTKKMMKIIAIILVLLLLVCIGLIAFMYYIQTTQLKIAINGANNAKLENVLVFENGKVYIPIRAFSEYVGYESSNGGYKQYTEDTTKCYVECSNEVATFELNSNKIYKTLLDGNNNSEYYEIDEPVKMINNQLYTTIEGAQIAFNISMSYNQEANQVSIFTLPYLVTYYTNKFQNSAISDDKVIFSNQKALLYNMIIVKNADEHYGVYGLDGKEILGTKYASIEFIESTQEFIVTTIEKKVGIMASNATTKISPEYDDIKQIDKDAGLYLATNNKKQGVINSTGSIVIYLEHDQIGVDSTKYNSSEIQNPYLLYEKCIPVKRNNKWGLYDKTGKQITEIIYDELGCSAGSGSTGDKTANNVLLIPKYNGIVVKSGDLYGLIDDEGKQLLPIVLESIYSTTTAGEVIYSMIYNEQVMNVITYIETYVKPSTTNNTTNNEQVTNTTNSTTNETNQTSNSINNNTNQDSNNINNETNTQITNNTLTNEQASENVTNQVSVPTGTNAVQNDTNTQQNQINSQNSITTPNTNVQ